MTRYVGFSVALFTCWLVHDTGQVADATFDCKFDTPRFEIVRGDLGLIIGRSVRCGIMIR